MNWRLISLLMQKDWSECFKSRQILLFLLFFPLFLIVIIPGFIVGLMLYAPNNTNSQGIDSLLKLLPPLTTNWQYLTLPLQMAIFFAIMTQFFILLVPMMTASTIGADSIVGEKERKTIEVLLALPMTDRDILTAKILSAIIPSLIATWGYAILHILVIDFLLYPFLQYLFLPDIRFILLTGLLTPLLGFLTVTFVVMISSRVANTRDAQQLTGILVLPAILLLVGQIILLLIDVTFISVGTVLFFILSLIFFRLSEKAFNRERIMTQR